VQVFRRFLNYAQVLVGLEQVLGRFCAGFCTLEKLGQYALTAGGKGANPLLGDRKQRQERRGKNELLLLLGFDMLCFIKYFTFC